MTDRVLMFNMLPFDFDAPLPIDVGRGVWLDDSNQYLMHLRNDAKVLLAPRDLMGRGVCNVCLRRTLSTSATWKNADRDLWLALVAMRLSIPFAFETTGLASFRGNAVSRIAKHAFSSPINYPGLSAFDSGDVWRAAALHRRIATLNGAGLERVLSGFTYFTHATMGLVTSWQLTALGLVAALEAIFPQPDWKVAQTLARQGRRVPTYGARLGRRVSAFVSSVRKQAGVRAWLSGFYRATRNNIAHGVHVSSSTGPVSTANAQDVARLAEVTRLVMLGVVGYPDATLAATFPIQARSATRQRVLDALGTAPSTYLSPGHIGAW